MKKHSISLVLLLFCFGLQSQSTQTIATGAGYQKQSYSSLATGTEKQVANTAWHIAFSVFGDQDAGVFVNESSGSSMGNPLPQVELYDAVTDNFDEQPDPSLFESFRLYNAEKSWAYGGFNERRDSLDPNDQGWGIVNGTPGNVFGTEVYVVKLPTGEYFKVKIVSLESGVYTFKYAALDGTGVQTKTIAKADFPGKTLAYFNLSTGATVDVEPAGGFDLLFCRYTTPLLVPGTSDYVPYDVTGILTGLGIQVAEADGVDPATVSFANYEQQLQSELDVIGYDWKSFPSTSWVLDLDRVFFLKARNNHVWKLHFLTFEGSLTGKSTFEKTDLGLFSAVEEPQALGMEAMIYPNPAQDVATLVLDVPANLAIEAQLSATDVLGRKVLAQNIALQGGFQAINIPVNNWLSGTYQLNLQAGGVHISLGRLVKI